MAHRFVKEMSPGETINDIYMVRDPILRSTTRGDFYIAMFLCDRTGQLNGRMWQASENVYKSLPKPGFVHIKGRTELYQDNLQLVVNTVTPIDPSKVEVADFLAHTSNDIGQMFDEIKEAVGSIENASLKALTGAFLADTEMMKNFCRVPGGMKMHHGYIGGLLEHTHNMMRVAQAILPLFPHVQRDLVLAGILLHDMGKTEELSYDMAFSYTDSGQLIGHINKTLVMIHQKADALWSEGVEVREDVVDALGHIILSHHGQFEYGSPKLPATAEAFMVYYLDDLDAKMNQVNAAIEGELSDSNWTAWQNPLQTRLYRKRIE